MNIIREMREKNKKDKTLTVISALMSFMSILLTGIGLVVMGGILPPIALALSAAALVVAILGHKKCNDISTLLSIVAALVAMAFALVIVIVVFIAL